MEPEIHFASLPAGLFEPPRVERAINCPRLRRRGGVECGGASIGCVFAGALSRARYGHRSARDVAVECRWIDEDDTSA